MDELVEEIPPHHEITQVPKLKTKLGCAISRDSGAHTQPQQTGKGFQLSACNPSELQQRHPTSAAASLDLLILRPAVLVIGCVCEGLRSQCYATNYLRFVDCHFNVDTFEEDLYLTAVIFEDSYFNDGNAEDCLCYHDQLEPIQVLPLPTLPLSRVA